MTKTVILSRRTLQSKLINVSVLALMLLMSFCFLSSTPVSAASHAKLASHATVRTIFYVHTANASNQYSVYSHITMLDNPVTNNNPGAVVIAMPNYSLSYITDTHALGAFYTGSRWCIFHEDQTPITPGETFNVYAASS